MFVKNFLASGDFLTIVPVGYPMTVQYNSEGKIEKAYKWWGDSRVELPRNVLNKLIQSSKVPSNVALKGGSTLVEGVLYTSRMFKGSGKLPDCVMDVMLDSFLEDECDFNFFAGNVESHSSSFYGSAQVRQWLTFSRFNVLPGILIPHNFNESNFSSIIRKDDYPFVYPLITNYMYFRKGVCEFHSVGLIQKEVKEVSKEVSPSGWILAILGFSDGSAGKYEYHELCKFNIHSGSNIVMHEEGDIIYSYSDTPEIVDRVITCDFCGKQLIVKNDARLRCDDPHCNSRLFRRTANMLRLFDLPAISYDRYLEYTQEFGIQYSPIDILDAYEYQDAKIEVNIANILNAGTDTDLRIPRETFDLVCSKCNNKLSTVEYYIQNAERILSDLELYYDKPTEKWVDWLVSNPEDVLDIMSLFHHDKIRIVGTNRKYDGLPIFRGRTILVTGQFNHGSLADVAAILTSYSAKVVNNMNTDIDCVVVGDMHENINGQYIRKAKELNIPVMSESEFFNKYDIDDDLVENL